MLAWLWAHPIAFVLFVLFAEKVVLGLANWATYPADMEEWERVKREEPRRAALVQLLRGYGFYPAKVVLALRGLVHGALPAPVRVAVEEAQKPPNPHLGSTLDVEHMAETGEVRTMEERAAQGGKAS